MNLTEKHILLNALIQQEKRLIERANKLHEHYYPHPNPDSHKDWNGYLKIVSKHKESDNFKKEMRIRQMALDLNVKINKYEQYILDIALNDIENL